MIRFACCLICTAILCAADPAVLAGAGKTDSWKTINPKESPGGKVELSTAGDAVILAYDFSGGGSFLGMRYMGAIPTEAAAIVMSLTSDADVTMKFRLVTSDGRTFSGNQVKLKAGSASEVTLATGVDWTEAWGGPADAASKSPKGPIKQFVILAFKDKKAAAPTGKITVANVRAVAK